MHMGHIVKLAFVGLLCWANWLVAAVNVLVKYLKKISILFDYQAYLREW